jgi:hypothetical protein
VATDSKQVVRDYLDALLAGDVDAIRASFAEDATWTINGSLPIAGPWKGRDTIVDDFLSELGGSLYEPGSLRFDFSTLIGEGDTVALEWTVSARTMGGEDYENAYCGIFVVRDGRIQEVREYLDTAQAERKLFTKAKTPA